MKALDGIPYVVKHLKDEDDGGKVLYMATYVTYMHWRIINIVIGLIFRQTGPKCAWFPQPELLFSF